MQQVHYKTVLPKKNIITIVIEVVNSLIFSCQCFKECGYGSFCLL